MSESSTENDNSGSSLLPGNLDPDADPALRTVLKTVPRGAFALAGLTVALLLGAWLFVYFCVFLPRGPIS